MTDNEIIKALECCTNNKGTGSYVDCPLANYAFEECADILRTEAYNLINRQKDKIKEFDERNIIYRGTVEWQAKEINRQKVEIERLEKEAEDKERAYNDEFCLRKEWQTKCREVLKEKQIIGSEAIEKFAERLKEGIQENHYYTSTEDMGNRKRYAHITNIKDFSQYIDNLVKEMTEVETNQRKEDEGK